jgi:hypothetical protein
MADPDHLPVEIQSAALAVRDAYLFAVANPEILQEIPCYCGCGTMGHTSNLSCFASPTEEGALEFDSHALGCSICVDIAQDVMRLMRQQAQLSEIQSFVHSRYSRYGPPTGAVAPP